MAEQLKSSDNNEHFSFVDDKVFIEEIKECVIQPLMEQGYKNILKEDD